MLVRIAVRSGQARLPEGNENGREECDRSVSQFVSESWHGSNAIWLMQSALKQEADQPCGVVSDPKIADFRTALGRARSGNKIADPINIFAPRCGLDTTCHIYSKRPGLVDRFSYIFRI